MKHECMATTLKPKPNNPNKSVQKSQERKNHINFCQMWRFCSLFSLIVISWCIMNFCHKVVRNSQNCGKTNHGFCTMIAHQLTYIDACAWVFGQKQNRNHALTTAFTGLGPRSLFSLPKTEDTDERKAFGYFWGDKRKIETGTVVESKFDKCFEDWKKAGISVLYLRRITMKGTIYTLYVYVYLGMTYITMTTLRALELTGGHSHWAKVTVWQDCSSKSLGLLQQPGYD